MYMRGSGGTRLTHRTDNLTFHNYLSNLHIDFCHMAVRRKYDLRTSICGRHIDMFNDDMQSESIGLIRHLRDHTICNGDYGSTDRRLDIHCRMTAGIFETVEFITAEIRHGIRNLCIPKTIFFVGIT